MHDERAERAAMKMLSRLSMRPRVIKFRLSKYALYGWVSTPGRSACVFNIAAKVAVEVTPQRNGGNAEQSLRPPGAEHDRTVPERLSYGLRPRVRPSSAPTDP